MGSETLFHTRLADGTIQTYHATDAALTAYVGNDMQQQLEAQAYEARRAGVNALAPWLGHKLVSTQASRGTYLTDLVTSGQIDLYNGGWSC